MVQLSHLYMTTGKTIALTIQNFDGKVKVKLTQSCPTACNLDSILNIRDIALPTKVHLIKAMVFPVVVYRCESWTIKKTGY